MGRKKLYQTEADRKAAHAAQQKAYANWKRLDREAEIKELKRKLKETQKAWTSRAGQRQRLLGLAEMATPEELKTLYKMMAKRMHPDTGGDEAEMTALNLLLDEITKFATKS